MGRLHCNTHVDLGNVHFALQHSQFTSCSQFLRCILDKLADLLDGMVLMGGDSNFVARDECRLDVKAGACSRDEGAAVFARMFEGFSELACNNFSWRSKEYGHVTKAARLD